MKRARDRLQMEAVGRAVQRTKRLKCWYMDGKHGFQSKKGRMDEAWSRCSDLSITSCTQYSETL